MTREEILEEVGHLQYLYQMKGVIRYHHTRNEEMDTESVAEHVYGMLVLAHYFLPLEDPEHTWDHGKIYDMILWHDIDEIETGDKIGYLKTDADRANEAVAAQKAIASIPQNMQAAVETLMNEYEALQTKEAQFAKAIDRLEPAFHLFNENGKKIMHKNRTTLDEHQRIKEKYVAPFPVLRAFNTVITEEMVKGGYFTAEESSMVH